MASSPSAPKPIDPNTVIAAQEQANRTNRITPFGSQTYDAQGNLTTSLPQGTQTAFNNVSNLAGNQQQLLQQPQGIGNLQQSIMNNIASRYSPPQGGGQKQGQQSMPPMGMTQGGAPNASAWQGIESKIWGQQ